MKDWNWLKHIVKISVLTIMCLIILSACLNGGFDAKKHHYNEKGRHEYPLSDIGGLQIDEKHIYCFNDRLFCVNTYDKNGKFQYSLIVPERDRNGAGTIYLKEGYLCVKNRHGDVYQYKDGRFCYRVLCDEEYENATVYNENDGVLLQSPVKADEVVGFFDGEIVFAASDEEFLEDYELTKVIDDITYSVEGLFPALKIDGKVIDKTQRIRSFFGSYICALIVFGIGAIVIDRLSDKLEMYFDKKIN